MSTPEVTRHGRPGMARQDPARRGSAWQGEAGPADEARGAIGTAPREARATTPEQCYALGVRDLDKHLPQQPSEARPLVSMLSAGIQELMESKSGTEENDAA